MINLEQAFSDTEKTAESARKSATGLATQAKALERAAKSGNIAAIRREQSKLAEALIGLQQGSAKCRFILVVHRRGGGAVPQ